MWQPDVLAVRLRGLVLPAVLVAIGMLGASACSDQQALESGIRCGDITCDQNQICCLDCAGHGVCGAPGSLCTGAGCVIDVAIGDGSLDGSANDAGAPGLQCVDKTCASGKACCIDCDETGFCVNPGDPCPGVACEVCPTDCGTYCEWAPAACPNPGCRCPEPGDGCPADCAPWCAGQHPSCPAPQLDCGRNCGFAELLADLEAEGHVLVMVGLVLSTGPFAPEGNLDPAEVEEQREAIAAARKALLESLAGEDFDVISRYDSIPHVALRVDANALDKLRSSAYVKSIHQNEAVGPN